MDAKDAIFKGLKVLGGYTNAFRTKKGSSTLRRSQTIFNLRSRHTFLNSA